jgi:hypothetical protein
MMPDQPGSEHQAGFNFTDGLSIEGGRPATRWFAI